MRGFVFSGSTRRSDSGHPPTFPPASVRTRQIRRAARVLEAQLQNATGRERSALSDLAKRSGSFRRIALKHALIAGDLRRTPVGVVDQEDLARLVERLQTAAQPGQDGGHVAPDERRGLQQPRQRNGGRIAVVEAGAAGVAGVRRRRYVARLTELHPYVKTQK